jgi:hypothetical protein
MTSAESQKTKNNTRENGNSDIGSVTAVIKSRSLAETCESHA